MNTLHSPIPSVLALGLFAMAAAAQAPATTSHWSTYLGGAGHDLAAAVRRGPGGLLVVAGTTTSPGLATAGAVQTAYAGGGDAFVAMIDPSLGPGQQLLWCTYLGGSGTELVFDAIVDGGGVTTVVGMTDSNNMPMNGSGQLPTGFQPTKNGRSDGFIARIDPSGSVLLYATHIGGSADERLCGVAVDASGQIAVIGVTESSNLPGTSGAPGPAGSLSGIYLGGSTDAFVARIDPGAAPAQQLLWASYFGGPGRDGDLYIDFVNNGGIGSYWLGNAAKQHVAFGPGNDIVAVTVTNPPYSVNATTPGALQTTGNGMSDVYVAGIHPLGTALNYGTFFGGTARDFPWAMALHPAGGLVIAGGSGPGMPTTPCAPQPNNTSGTMDGFVCWIDPALGTGRAQLRYSTYFGGDGTEDLFKAVAIESSGVMTLAGSGFRGSFANPFVTTPGCLLPSSLVNPWDRCGTVVRLTTDGTCPPALVYSTFLGRGWTVMHGVVLDEVGDAYVAGSTTDLTYPTVGAMQSASGGLRDMAITHLPLLAGGTSRHDLDLATAACAEPLYASTLSAPAVPNLTFALSATNAPPASFGLVVLGFGTPAGWRSPLPAPLNANLLVQPPHTPGSIVPSNGLGFAAFQLPLRLTTPVGLAVDVQWLLLTNTACPGSGQVAGSERLVFTTF